MIKKDEIIIALSIKTLRWNDWPRNLPSSAEPPRNDVIRQALLDRKARLAAAGTVTRKERIMAFLEQRVWPHVPPDASRGWSKQEEERAPGYGAHGEPV